MSRERTSARVWVFVAFSAVATHAAGLAVCSGRDRPSTPEETLRATFERHHRQITGKDDKNLWHGLSPTYRVLILEGGDSDYAPYTALGREPSRDVDKFPGIGLGPYVSSSWDGESEYEIAIDGRAALIAYRDPGMPGWWCGQTYVRVDETWYLDQIQGCSPNHTPVRELLKFLLGFAPKGDRAETR